MAHIILILKIHLSEREKEINNKKQRRDEKTILIYRLISGPRKDRQKQHYGSSKSLSASMMARKPHLNYKNNNK